MTPHLKQETHFPPQPVSKNRLNYMGTSPSPLFLIPLFPSVMHINKLWNPEVAPHGKGKKPLVSAQPPVLPCSDWEDLALMVAWGVLWH